MLIVGGVNMPIYKPIEYFVILNALVSYYVYSRVDTTQAQRITNRVKIYVNGVQETSFSTSN